MPKFMQIVQSAKDRINELHMKWKLVKEINKFIEHYYSLPTNIKELNPEFTHILKLVDYNALSREPIKKIIITIPFDEKDTETFDIEIEWEEWATIKYSDWRDSCEYINNIERKSIELWLETLERENEYVEKLEEQLKIHTDNVKKLEEYKFSNEYLNSKQNENGEPKESKDESNWE